MKILISPAKSLDLNSDFGNFECSVPKFLNKTSEINQVLKEKSVSELKNIQGISEKLADLNWKRNNEFNKEHSSKNSRPAIFTFDGDVYNGIDSKTLNSEDINQLQKSLIILSGLYGALKPLDLIQPYRLEMGTKLAVNGSRNLYEFWADAITNDLVKELKSDSILVNLASNEYFNVIKKSKIEQTIITPVFKDFKNGNLKVISFYAKKARGMMVRFIVKNKCKNLQEIQSFNLGGYSYSEEHTIDSNSPVFIR